MIVSVNMKLSNSYDTDKCTYKLCFLALVLWYPHLASCEIVAPVMCVTGRFTMGSRAFITCFFNRDVNKTKHNFNLVQYSGEGQSGNHVVLCNWRTHELTCNTALDFYFQPLVSDRITVEIESVSERHAGRYACQILPGENIPVETCILQLSNKTSEPCATDVNAGGQTCYNNIEAEEGSKRAAIALAVCLGMLLVLVFLVIAGLVRRHGSVHKLYSAVWYCTEKQFSSDGNDSTDGRVAAELGQFLDSAEDSISMIVQKNPSDKSNQRSKAVQTPTAKKWNYGIQTYEKEDFPVEDWTAFTVREWLMDTAVKQYQMLIDSQVTGAQLLDLNHKTTLVSTHKMKSKRAEKLKEEITELIKANNQRKDVWKRDAKQRYEEV